MRGVPRFMGDNVVIIYFNGQEKFIAEALVLTQFLNQENVVTAGCAIAINHQFIPKSNYHSTLFKRPRYY